MNAIKKARYAVIHIGLFYMSYQNYNCVWKYSYKLSYTAFFELFTNPEFNLNLIYLLPQEFLGEDVSKQ